jgi:hypothetical protein
MATANVRANTARTNSMQPEIRKIVTYDEEVLIEGFKPAQTPWRMFAVAAVVKNPWAGRFVADLKPEIQAYGPVLGEMMTKRMIDLAGSGDAIEAYGKAAVVGLNGEIEHASGLIHTFAPFSLTTSTAVSFSGFSPYSRYLACWISPSRSPASSKRCTSSASPIHPSKALITSRMFGLQSSNLA